MSKNNRRNWPFVQKKKKNYNYANPLYIYKYIYIYTTITFRIHEQVEGRREASPGGQVLPNSGIVTLLHLQ
jgi:hypothetical protein